MRTLTINVIRALHHWLQRTLANMIWKQIDHLHKRKQQADKAIQSAKDFAAEVERDCIAYKEACTEKSAKLLAEVADL